MKKLQPEFLHTILECNPDRGILLWRPRTVDLFNGISVAHRQALCQTWNSRFAHKIAFTAINRGYLTGTIFGEFVRAHRAIFAMVHGRWPVEVDHINGDRSDNRLVNLREVTRRENKFNSSLYSNNTSGFTGVSWNKDKQKWCAYIAPYGRQRQIGCFELLADAVAARARASAEEGFHPNHGKKPRLAIAAALTVMVAP